MKVLVAGGTGYLGAAVCDILRSRGHDVSVTARPDEAAAPGDVTDLRATEALLARGGFDAILNLAATGVTSGSSSLDEMVSVNTHGAAGLARAAAALSSRPWYVHVASSTEPREGEEPESAYSSTKAAGTAATRSTLEAAGMPHAILTIHNTYGPGQPAGRFVADVVRSLRRGETVRIEHPDRVRDFCYVTDVVEHLANVVERGRVAGQTSGREVGSGHGVSLREVAILACEVLGVPSGLVIGKEESGEDPYAYRVADSFAAGFLECTTPLSVGLTRLVDVSD